MARKWQYIVVHHNGVAGRTIDDIRRTHRGFGWRDVGYHKVIHENGDVLRGRPEDKAGAHRRGLNTKALGLCLIGNGNRKDMNESQYLAACVIIREWQLAYGIPTENVVGHRETNPLVAKKYRTRKQCPGRKVDMDKLRAMLDHQYDG